MTRGASQATDRVTKALLGAISASGMTDKAILIRAGITNRSTISQYRLGRLTPTAETMTKILDAIGADFTIHVTTDLPLSFNQIREASK